MFKKIAVLVVTATAAATLSAPALADRGNKHHGHPGYHGGHYAAKHKVVHHYYRPAPRPKVVHHYYHPAPQPVMVVHRHEPVVPLLVGAVIGAAIVHHAVTQY